MRYKIQIETYNGGWSDLRESSNGENYEPCLFPTRNAALAAREEFSELSEFLETTRIVTAETPETENIYASEQNNSPPALGGKPASTSAQATL